jgi:type I restriction enzyme S subunit
MPSLTEQKKVSDCIASLDDQLVAVEQKLNALNDHKKGLMQQLFPSLDEAKG